MENQIQAYCNVCDRNVEIVFYDDILELGLCFKCKGNKPAQASYLLALLERF